MARTTRVKAILFRIFYSTTFTLVFLLTIAFAAAGPIDAIYQSYRRNRLLDIFTIAGIYVLTGLLAILLYSTRLYTNRQLLKDIPKTYMPIDKRELGNRRVARLIEDCRNRANVVGYLARPRARRVEKEVGYAGARIRTLLKPEHRKESRIFEPQWGTIAHPGWSSPAARETPNLDYNTVVGELTDLIEARAVSLAPIDPSLGTDDDGNPTVDESIIEALTRPEEQGMRAYIAHLISLDVLPDNSLSIAFLTLYERARFAPDPLSEEEFKQLMRMFAEILRTMKTLNTDRLDLTDHDSTPDQDQNLYNTHAIKDASKTSQITKNTAATVSTSSLASDSSSIAGSVRHHRSLHSHIQPTTSYITTHPQPAISHTTSYLTAPPRISHDSVRSLSSSEAYHDAEGSDWANPTSRPPFFRARSSQSQSQSQSRGSGRTARSRLHGGGRRRSRLRRAISRASIESEGGASLRSVKSQGSVIRLNPRFDGAGAGDGDGQVGREMLPFEYIVPNDGGDNEAVSDRGSVRRQVL
ncbi:hypothetical protein OHC33_000396 [Knufia fluminis]|uniref:Defect at low temperature protein 1 n=1 Tax=Knufia fluminis TaxID=191047 RepID=A0AAN8ETI2_9EURO|nr:hypothetical protein OHC33_000396 [Knufia fluminis]